jgi:hypothetical protein
MLAATHAYKIPLLMVASSVLIEGGLEDLLIEGGLEDLLIEYGLKFLL